MAAPADYGARHLFCSGCRTTGPQNNLQEVIMFYDLKKSTYEDRRVSKTNEQSTKPVLSYTAGTIHSFDMIVTLIIWIISSRKSNID